MASQFDTIRNRIRRGEEAKKRVLERVYSPKPEPQETSMFDAIRNRSLEPEPSTAHAGTTMQNFPDINPLKSSLMRATVGDKQAKQTWEQASGVQFKPIFGPPPPPQKSEYEKGLQAIEEKRPAGFWGNVYDYTVGPFAKANNWLWYGNDPGSFVTRAVGTGGEMVLGTPSARPATTGNAAADKAADILGTVGGVAGMAFNPAAAGVKGQNLLTGPLNVARGALSTNAGQKAQRALSYGINSTMPRMSTATADRLARTSLEGAITGTVGGVAQGLVQGQDSNQDILRNAALGAGLGAVGDPIISSLPGVAKGLSGRLKNTGSSIKEGLQEVSPNANLGISALNKRLSPYDNLKTDTKSQIRSRAQMDPIKLSGTANRMYTALVDDVHSLNQFDKLTERVLGKPLDASESTHKLALSSRGSDMISRQIVTDKLVDKGGNVVSDSLKDILTKLPRGKFVDFEDYLINKHAITRSKREEKVFRDELNWTPEVGKNKIDDYEAEFPQFKEVSDQLYDFNKNMVNKWLVETGMITPEQAKAWFDANPYYIPNKRYFTDLEKTGKGFGGKSGGYGNVSTPVKGYQKGGSQRQIISPIEATIENVDTYVKAAKRNQVMQQFIKNIEQNPEAFKDFAEIVKQPERLDDITKIMMSEDGIEELLSRFSEDFDKVMQRTKLDKDNVVRVLVNGEPVHVKINDKSLLEAITALGPDSGGKLLDAIGWFTNKMKMLTTGANPIFNITRNVFRDIPQAYVASKSTNNPLRFIFDLADASIQIIRNKDLYRQYKSLGGGHSSSVAANRNLLAQSKRSVLPQNPIKGVVPRAWSALENMMNAIESAPRLAEYKRISKNGTGDESQLMKAIYEAQDLTTNFKRRGTLTRELDKVFPYFNAAIQGMDRFARMYKDDPVKAAIKSVLTITIPSLVAYAVNHDDPNYQKTSNRIKDSFILIPKGDGTFYRIAKPQELGALFADIPERLMRKLQDEDPAAFRDFSDHLRTTFLPPGVSGAFKDGSIVDKALGVMGDTTLGPFFNVAQNRNFADAPIVPGYLERKSPDLQSDARTSSLSKWIGEKTNTSPKQLDYLIRQYTGVIGQLGLPMMSPAGQGNNALESFGNAFVQNMSVDPVYSNDLSTEFYNYKDQLDQAFVDRKDKPLPKWYHDGLRKQFGKISENMSSIRTQMRELEGDTKIDKKQKREKLRQMQESINQLAQKGIEIANGRVPYKD
ncbi:LPD38 domain-containing protein [Paenibacillus sp. DMB20]|uniref:LPD38 domain-containing protein n=1 Tax=Paenibacillus sp. DMB20 TaxID=1642570 RepID=UPI0006280096|nr:LPD38 domain-containing protein [Paenibacillus sp. DMB20]KKO51163.1 hypothetical protein XI25_29705 [Paenibacillus sp. DMB20]